MDQLFVVWFFGCQSLFGPKILSMADPYSLFDSCVGALILKIGSDIIAFVSARSSAG